MNIPKKMLAEEKQRAARENEAAFRDILRDAKNRFPDFIPCTINPDADIETLLSLFTPVLSMGFGIGEFEVGPENSDQTDDLQEFKLHSDALMENEAVIEFHSFHILSGGNMILLYDITPNQQVQFKGEAPGIRMMS